MSTFISPEQFGNAFIPQRIRPYIRKYVEKAGQTEVPYKAFGIIFFAVILLTFFIWAIYIFIPLMTGDEKIRILGYIIKISPVSMFFINFLSWIVIPLILSALAMLCIWLYYELIIYKRTKEIEDILPDFLQAVSVNLRAGMTFDKALWNSVSPDFEVLSKEIEIVAKKSMTGRDIENALQDFSDKYKSGIVKEAIELIIIGLKSGGSVTDLLDRLVANLRQTSNLKKELIAAVSGNIFFITIIAVVISPILFALSYNLLIIIQSLGGRLGGAGNAIMGGFSFGTEAVKPADFILFSKLAVLSISLLSAMIISNIKSGNLKGGFKYLPIFTIISYIIYLLALAAFNMLFGQLFV